MSAVFKRGLHVGEVIEQFLGQSDNDNKTPFFALRFQIVARVEGNQEYSVEPATRTVYLYLSEASLEMTTDALVHLGYDQPTLKFLSPQVDGYHNFVGTRCDLWCKIESYNGKEKEKWSISLPREKKEVTPIDDKEKRRLDALFGKAMKGKVKAAPAAAKTPEPVAAGFVPPPPEGDEIPF